LQLRLAGSKVTVIAYGAFPTRFTRTFDLRDYFRAETVTQIKSEDVVLSSELPAVEIWPGPPDDRTEHIRLSTILWEG
jgi:hypothetical protein